MSTRATLLAVLLQRGPQPTLTLAQHFGWTVGRVEKEMGLLAQAGLAHKGDFAWHLGPAPHCAPAPSGRCSVALQNTPRGCPRAGTCAQDSEPRPPKTNRRAKVLQILEGGPRTMSALRDLVGGGVDRMRTLLHDMLAEGSIVACGPRDPKHPVLYHLPHQAAPEGRPGASQALANAARQRSVSMRAAARVRLLTLMERTKASMSAYEWAAAAKAGREAAQAILLDLVAEGLVLARLRRLAKGAPVRVYHHASAPEPAKKTSAPELHGPPVKREPITGPLAEVLQHGPRRSSECDQRELMSLLSARKAGVYAGWAYLTHDPNLAPVLTEVLGGTEVKYRPVRGGLEMLAPERKRGIVVHSRDGLAVEMGGQSWRDRAMGTEVAR